MDKDSCEGSFISQKVLERTVLKELNSLIDKYLNVDKLEEGIVLTQFGEEREKLEKEISQYQISIQKKSKAIKDTYIDKVNGIISQEQFMEFNESFSSGKGKFRKFTSRKAKETIRT